MFISHGSCLMLVCCLCASHSASEQGYYLFMDQIKVSVTRRVPNLAMTRKKVYPFPCKIMELSVITDGSEGSFIARQESETRAF